MPKIRVKLQRTERIISEAVYDGEMSADDLARMKAGDPSPKVWAESGLPTFMKSSDWHRTNHFAAPDYLMLSFEDVPEDDAAAKG